MEREISMKEIGDPSVMKCISRERERTRANENRDNSDKGRLKRIFYPEVPRGIGSAFRDEEILMPLFSFPRYFHSLMTSAE